MPTPYASCRRYNTVYKVNVSSGCYGEYVRRTRRYDLVVTRSKFDRLTKLRKKAKKELEKAKDEEERIAEKLRV